MEDRSQQILAVALLFFVLSWISVLLRIYVRSYVIKAFGSDDIAMLITLLLFTAYLTCQFGGVAHGSGKHRSEITNENAEIALRWWFFCEIFYACSTSVLKVAIGLFLLRITVQPIHIWLIRIIMVASIVLGITYAFVILFQCNPISFWWDLSINAHGTCLSPEAVLYTSYVVSSLNSVADWFFGLLPFLIVKDLQMKFRLKAIVATILGFAAIGSTATLVRMPYLWTLREYKGEFLYRTTDVAIWTTVEVGVGITAGCIATLKPLMKNFMDILGVQSTTDPSSKGLPWSKSTKNRNHPSKHGYSRHGQPLDDLRPTNDKSMTITTVTGRTRNTTEPKGLTSWADRTRRDSEEDTFPVIALTGAATMDLKAWQGGISKSVEVTTTEERSSAKSGSSSLGDLDEERTLPGKPTMVYERL